MSTLMQEWRFAARSLLKTPGFTIAAILTLGVAIGACTAIYSVVYGVTLQPLPYIDPNRLVHLWQVNRDGGRSGFSDPNFEDLRVQAPGFRAAAEYSQTTSSVVAGTLPLRARTAAVSREFFDVFQMRPVVGRRFATEALHEGAAPTAVIGYRFWQQHFGGTIDLPALTLRVDGKPHAVVGVLPPEFAFPAGVEIWTPRELRPRNPYRTGHNWRVVARLQDGVTLAVARGDATAVARRLEREYGDATWMTDVLLVPLREELVGRVRPVLLLLLTSVALLLVVACANLTNLLLVRVSARRRELAVRSALGASRASLALPFVVESLLLAAAGGAVGLALAQAGVGALTFAEPTDLPRVTEVRLSWPVLTFALGVTMLTVLALSSASAWRAGRPDIVEWLKGAQRGQAGRASAGRLRSTLVVGQLAVSLVLLVAAGLLGRSFVVLLNQDPGFRTEGLLTIELSSPDPEIRLTTGGVEILDPASLARQAQLHERLIQRLRVLPGVLEAGGINRFPMPGGYSNGRFLIIRGDEGQTLEELQALSNDPERTGDAEFRVASAGYFRAMGIPLVHGHQIDDGDTPEAPHVALISESLARRRWPSQDPIGLRIQFGGMDGNLRVFTIVGVVGDIRERGLDWEPVPTFYAEYRQRPLSTSDFTVVLQTSVNPSSVVEPARHIIREVAREVPPRFRTVNQIVAASVTGRRFTLALAGSFAGAAFLLAVLGVYGVLSYSVAHRTQEFGVRMALGAQPADVRRLVLREASRLVFIGLALGVSAALAGSRLIESVLFGIRSTDPSTYFAVAGILALAAFVAPQRYHRSSPCSPTLASKLPALSGGISISR